MTKRKVSKNDLEFLSGELRYWEDEGILPAGKVEELQGMYEAEKRLSFTKTLLYVGSILIGAGILSFIASNWQDIGRVEKFLIIIALFMASNFAGFKMEENFPKTSRSFYYLGGLVFGAGIFLVGQIFNFGGDFQGAFLWWSLGILPLAWFLRDKWILLAASIFVIIYLLQQPFLEGTMVPFWIFLWIAAIYRMNDRIGFSNPVGFTTVIQILLFIAVVFNYITAADNKTYYVLCLIYLMIGIFLVFSQKKIRKIYCTAGYLAHGLAALQLSFGEAWPINWFYIPFSILYLIFVFYLVKKGSLLSIIILCVMIFRFYLDISFNFLPKSFVFIIGGLILLAFGFYFEKQRKKGGSRHE